MKIILGQKKQMTQVFQDDGRVIPVTIIHADPNVVTAVRTKEKNGYTAVQLGVGRKSKKRVAKPQLSEWGELGIFRWVREFNLPVAAEMTRGKKLDVSVFQAGDKVQVTGTSKGRGYAGVVKRHHFKGGPASHGHKDNLRAPGSIGATFPQHVMKGTRMAGRLGAAQVTVKNLIIVAVKPDTNDLYISGAVPGAINSLVAIRGI